MDIAAGVACVALAGAVGVTGGASGVAAVVVCGAAAAGLAGIAGNVYAGRDPLEGVLADAVIGGGTAGVVVAAGPVLRAAAHAVDTVPGSAIDDAARLGSNANNITPNVGAPNAPQTTRVYRVEGPGNARLDFSPSGNVTAKGDNMLFLNFGDEARAHQFLTQRVGQGHVDDVIKSFDVPTPFVDSVRAASVPQDLGRLYPSAPQLVDTTKAVDQYGLPACWIGNLNQAIVPGSGRMSC